MKFKFKNGYKGSANLWVYLYECDSVVCQQLIYPCTTGTHVGQVCSIRDFRHNGHTYLRVDN